MSSIWKGILAAASLSVIFTMTVFAGNDLEVQSNHQNVEATVQIIRDMYSKTNSGSYSVNGNQWLYSHDNSNEVVKAVVTNGDVVLDQAMKFNGYENYQIEYYYDNPECDGFVSGYGAPNFAFAVIDGKEYRYYFSGNAMLRRIDPDGTVTENPRTNNFMNQIFKTGCLYQNDLSVTPSRSLNQETIYFGHRYYDRIDHLALYSMVFEGDSSWLDTEHGLYTVDADTKIASVIKEEDTWREGDNGFTWLSRHLNTLPEDGGYFGSLECFQVSTTGNHVDEIQGIYATH